MSGEAEPGGAGESEGAPGGGGRGATATPEQLLSAARAARRQARRARHAYWFPLALFGVLICASVPFHVRRLPARSGALARGPSGSSFWHAVYQALHSAYLGGFGVLSSPDAAYYWLAAIPAGLAATAVWYRLRGHRAGLRTPSRGFVSTGLVLLTLALLIPVLATSTGGPLGILMPGDLLVRGTFPLVLIGLGLGVLAWAERSVALTVITAGYLALSLAASLYTIQNVLYRLGWNLSPAVSALPNIVLPALVLLLAGAGTWAVQRRYRVVPASATGPEAS